MRKQEQSIARWSEALDVVHVTLANRSGSALYVAELTKAQAEVGLTVGLIIPSDFEWISQLDHPRIKIITIPVTAHSAPTFFQSASRAIRSARYIAAAIGDIGKSRDKPLVHCNFVSPGLSQLIASAAARRHGVKVLITMHDVLPHYLRTAPLFALMDILAHWLSFRLTNLVHVHTHTQLKQLSRTYNVPQTNCIVLPHGISLRDTPITPQSPDAENPTFLVIGSLRKNKNILEVIKAFVELRRLHKTSRLVIAGRPPRSEKKYWQECLTFIKEHPDNIVINDRYLTHDEFDNAITHATCVLLPYTSFSAQSGVAVRVASLGVPMIASSSVSLNDTPISSLCESLTISQVSAESINEAMKIVLEMPPSRRTQIGLSLRDYCFQNFSWKKVGSEFGQLYPSLKVK
jgi:glycosyltransferase involved in cell wall biosynthesis